MNLINSDDRFVRWQSNLRKQVTFTNNLLLTIAIGISGFVFSLLNSEKLAMFCENKYTIKFGLLLILSSVAVGILTNLSRIIDFRLTLKKIKKELNKEGISNSSKIAINVFGNITWILFYGQILSFITGVIFLSIGLFKLYF